MQGGAQSDHGGRIVRRRVAVGDRAADGAAVAHMRIADSLRQIRKRADGAAHFGGSSDFGVGGESADAHRRADVDAAQIVKPADIDDIRWRGEALLQCRDQRHAAGEIHAVLGVCPEVRRMLHAGRLAIVELVH